MKTTSLSTHAFSATRLARQCPGAQLARPVGIRAQNRRGQVKALAFEELARSIAHSGVLSLVRS